MVGVAAMLLAGCVREDGLPPVWTVVVNGVSVGGMLELEAGDVVTFTADAQDDVELALATMELVPMEQEFEVRTGSWPLSDEEELSGIQALVGRHWVVPDSVVGTLQLRAQLTDAVGQTTDPISFVFKVTNPFTSAVNLDSLNGVPFADLPLVPVVAPGEAVNLVGDVFDADGLNSVRVELEGPDGGVLQSWTWPTPGGLLCLLSDADLTLPENAGAGTYWIRIKSIDGALIPAHSYFPLSIPE